jgi:hypothetical protein
MKSSVTGTTLTAMVKATLSGSSSSLAADPSFNSPILLKTDDGGTLANHGKTVQGSGIFRTPFSIDGYDLKLFLTGTNSSSQPWSWIPPGDGGENWLHHINDAGDPQAGNLLYIEDIGKSTDDDNNDSLWNASYRTLATAQTGGTTGGSEVAKKTYVKTYTSTSSATYKGSGAKRSDTPDVVQGYNSYNGNGKGLWIFPSMTADLSGATVNKVEVYAYANHWYNNAGGTAYIKVHGYTSAPASSPSMTTAATSAGWPKPGGRWVTLPSSLYAGFKSGSYRGFGMGPGSSNSLSYYGRFNGGGGAKIRVTYTK